MPCLEEGGEMTYTNEEEVHQTIVNLAGLEHSLRTDGTPDKRSVVNNFRARTCESVRIFR